MPADATHGGQLGLDFSLSRDHDRSPSLPGEVGQRLERGAGAAEPIEQGSKSAWPDRFRSEQAEPVETLLVGQVLALVRQRQ
jgi:hypothetical protein